MAEEYSTTNLDGVSGKPSKKNSASPGFHAEKLITLEAVKKEQGDDSYKLEVNSVLAMYTKHGVSRVFSVNGRKLVSKCHWIDFADLDKEEALSMKRFLKSIGVMDFYNVQVEGVQGYPVRADADEMASMSQKPSFVSFMDVLRSQFDSAEELQPVLVARPNARASEIDLITDKSVISAYKRQTDNAPETVIKTYIVRSDDDDQLTCSFFSDGTPIPFHDSYFDPGTEFEEGIAKTLSDFIYDFSFVMNQGSFIQEFYYFDKNDPILIPDKSLESLLKSQLDSKALRKRKKQLKIGAVAISLIVAGGWLYSDYNSDAKIKERMLAQKAEQERQQRLKDQQNAELERNFRLSEQANQSVYPLGLALMGAVHNLLLLPPEISEGKRDDNWTLKDWNCLATKNYLMHHDEGLEYQCLVNYVGQELATSDLFKEWSNRLSITGRELATAEFYKKWDGRLKINAVNLRDVVTIGNTRSGILEYSFVVAPHAVDQSRVVSQTDLMGRFGAIADEGRSQDFGFMYSRESMVVDYLSNQQDAITLLKENHPDEKFLAYMHSFSLSAELGTVGALDITLPANSSIRRIHGTGSIITFEGATKYADNL